MPVPPRNVGLDVGPWHLPACAGSLVDVAVVAILHHPVDAHAPVAVVVVVALPEAPERVDGDLIVVAEVVAEHLEIAAVGLAAEHHALPVGCAGVVDDVTEAIGDSRAVLVVNGLPVVAEVEVPAAVGPDHEGMHGMIVLGLTRLREQRLLAVGFEVAVVIMKDDDIRRARHDHLPPRALPNHADAERRVDVAALVEDVLPVGPAVAIGVFEDQNPVARRPRLLLAAVVHHLTHPDATLGIDVDVGGARQHRLGGEQRGREARGHDERAGAVGRLDGAGGPADNDRGENDYEGAKDRPNHG